MSSAYTYFAARGGEMGTLTGSYLSFRMLSNTVVALGFFLLAPNLPGGLHFSLTDGAALPLALFLVVPLLETPSFAFSWSRIARGRAAAGQTPFLVEAVVRTGLLVFVALHYTQQTVNISMVTYMGYAYVAGALASCLVSLPFLGEVSFGGIGRALREMFRFASPLMGAMFLTYVVSTLTPFLVAYYLGNAQLQIFAVANAFFILLMYLPNAITVPLFPDLASLHIRGEDREIRRRARKGMRYAVMVLAPVVLGVIVFRVNLLNILYSNVVASGGFISGSTALVFLALAALPQSIFRIMGTVLDAIGQQRRELYVSAVQLVLLVGLLFLLVPPVRFLPAWGVTGAALALLGASLGGLLMNSYWLHTYLKVRLSPRPYLTILGAAAVTFTLFSKAAADAFNDLLGALPGHFAGPGYSAISTRLYSFALPVQLFPVLILVLATGVAAYLGVMLAVGELTRQDVRILLGSIGLPRGFREAVARLPWREDWPDPDAPPAEGTPPGNGVPGGKA